MKRRSADARIRGFVRALRGAWPGPGIPIGAVTLRNSAQAASCNRGMWLTQPDRLDGQTRYSEYKYSKALESQRHANFDSTCP